MQENKEAVKSTASLCFTADPEYHRRGMGRSTEKKQRKSLDRQLSARFGNGGPWPTALGSGILSLYIRQRITARLQTPQWLGVVSRLSCRQANDGRSVSRFQN